MPSLTRDPAESSAGPAPWFARPGFAVGAILALTLLRVVLAGLDQTELSTDEAQYWAWGQDLGFGYFSKPPLIAWVIRASSELVGHSVFAVRVPAPLIHGATAIVIWALMRRWASPAVAGLAALCYLTTPAVTLGSSLMTTDTPLLLAAAVALAAQIALARRRSEGQRSSWLAFGLGLALGIGVLAKQAMLFWLLAAGLAAWVSPAFRIRRGDALLAGLAMLAVVSPYLWWLANSGFVTVTHIGTITAGHGLSALRPVVFLAQQAAVVGPIFGVAMVLGGLRREDDAYRTGLLCFTLVPILIVLGQAVKGPALANWAVLYLVPGSILAAVWLSRHPVLARVSLVLGLAVSFALPAAKAFWPLVPGPQGKPLLSRYLGHSDFGTWAVQAAEDAHAATIVATERAQMADLAWFGASTGKALRAMPPSGPPSQHWEQTAAFDATVDPGPVVLIWPEDSPPPCADATPLSRHVSRPGAYQGRSFVLLRLDDPACLAPKDAAQ